ncbi:hypothetical protein BOX37_26685 [Nocardia mangyaensis]|uniref:DUF8176 domain-containing protein n=1 Tax=Nocardia mangyaensis TaxID=2213200 RepID=A0A1J0VY15_9NOCA|nr:hypothetical protein [Nocardia mangyaensis]APE36926.1 hypothetical protein BOX37_26685 [Nocardia mangyaensis]
MPAYDPVAIRRALSLPAAAPRRPRSPVRLVLGTVGALIMLLAGTAVIAALPEPNTDRTLPPTTTIAAHAACPAGDDDSTVVGNGAGDTDSGVGAILGFQYAYYVQRDGELARNFVALDTVNVSTAEDIQQAIDQEIPVGTTHCLRVIARDPGGYDVDITERRPDGTETVYRQHVRTVDRGGQALIHSIFGR